MLINSIDTSLLFFEFQGVQLLNYINLNKKKFILVSLSKNPKILYNMQLQDLNVRELSYLKFKSDNDVNIIITNLKSDTILSLYKDYYYDEIGKEILSVNKTNNIMEMAINIINKNSLRFRKNNKILVIGEILDQRTIYNTGDVFICDKYDDGIVLRIVRVLPYECCGKDSSIVNGYSMIIEEGNLENERINDK